MQKIVEKYLRDETKDADKDVSIVEYYFQEKKVYLKFHYEDEHVTQTHREFYKPMFAERGASLTFDPSLTKGYLTGPNTPQPKPLYLFRLEAEFFHREEMAEKKIRERENEVRKFVAFRYRADLWISIRLRGDGRRRGEREIPIFALRIFNEFYGFLKTGPTPYYNPAIFLKEKK